MQKLITCVYAHLRMCVYVYFLHLCMYLRLTASETDYVLLFVIIHGGFHVFLHSSGRGMTVITGFAVLNNFSKQSISFETHSYNYIRTQRWLNMLFFTQFLPLFIPPLFVPKFRGESRPIHCKHTHKHIVRQFFWSSRRISREFSANSSECALIPQFGFSFFWFPCVSLYFFSVVLIVYW